MRVFARVLCFVACLVAFTEVSATSAPYVTSVSPRQGSVAGGVRLTIQGENFAGSLPRNANETQSLSAESNEVFINGKACEVLPLHSTPNQIVCRTPADTDTWYHSVQVYVNGVPAGRCSSCTYRPNWRYTATLSEVRPGVAENDDLGLGGTFPTLSDSDAQHIITPSREVDVVSIKIDDPDIPNRNEPLGVGGSRLRILNDEDTEELLVTSSDYISARFASRRTAGYFNVSVTYADSGRPGDAAADPATYSFHYPTGTLYQTAIVPAVTTVWPQSGSVGGGSRITITGTSFDGETPSNNVVTVGGLPCTVTSSSETTIECEIDHDVSTLAPSLDASCPAGGADAVLKTETLSDGYWQGGRGAYHQFWEGVASIGAVPLAATAGDTSRYIDFLGTPYLQMPTNGGNRITAMFVAPFSTEYSFFVVSDDNSQLYMSDTDKLVVYKGDSGSILTAYETRWTSFESQPTRQTQNEVSAVKSLTAGEMRLLDVQHQNGAGPGHASVGVILHDPKYLPDAADAGSFRHIVEQTRVSLSYSGSTPTTVEVTASYPAGTDLTSATVDVAYGGQTLSLSLDPAAAADGLAAAAESAFMTSSATPVSDFGDVYFWKDYETGVANADRGATTHHRTDESFTGRGSMWLSLARARLFEFSVPASYNDGQFELSVGDGKYDSDDFPYFCMAAKMAPTARVNLVFADYVDPYDTAFKWRTVKLTQTTRSVGTNLGTWDFPQDNEWHHACIDLDSYLDTALGAAESHYIGTAMLWVDGGDFIKSPTSAVFLDTVSITQLPVDFGDSRVARADETTGDHFQSVATSVATTDTTTTVTLSFLTRCGLSWPADVDSAFSATTTAPDVTAVDATVTGVGSMSHPPSATLTIAGRPPITMDWPPVDLQTVLRAAETHGTPSVTWEGTCQASQYDIVWNGLQMDVPDVTLSFPAAEAGYTTGGAATITERAKGGIAFNPIPGDWLVNVAQNPTVAVTVNGIRSGCRPLPLDDPAVLAGVIDPSHAGCEFEFKDEDTPKVSSVTPSSGSASASITIAGTGFSDTASDVSVTVGGEPCVVSTTTATSIQCTVGSITAGTHPVVVYVAGSGYAVQADGGADTYAVGLSLTSVSPATGSIAGGTELTITGAGFPTATTPEAVAALANIVEISVGPGGATPCIPTSSSTTSLTCVTEPLVAGSDPDTVTVTVAAVCDVTPESTPASRRRLSTGGTTSSLAGSFSFMSSGESPAVTGVSPASGPVTGGSAVTISGANLDLGTGATVWFGGSPCAGVVVAGDGLSLTCTTSGAPSAGVVDVAVSLDGVGSAAGSQTFEYQLMVSAVSPSAVSVATGASFSVSGGGVGAMDVDLLAAVPQKTRTVVSVFGSAATPLVGETLELGFTGGSSTASVTVPDSAAGLSAAIASAFGALDGVDAGSVSVDAVLNTPSTPASGPSTTDDLLATVVMEYFSSASASLDVAFESNDRCTNPFFLDWDATACPRSAKLLYAAYYPARWPPAGPEPPLDLGTIEFLNAAQAQCDAEAKCLGYNPITTCQYAVPSFSPATAVMCGTAAAETAPCWQSFGESVRAPVKDDAGTIVSYDEYVLDETFVATIAELGFSFYRRQTGANLLTASVSSSPADFSAVVDVRTAEFARTDSCDRTDDGSDENAATCDWTLSPEDRCAAPGVTNAYGSAVVHDGLDAPALYFALESPPSGPGSWESPATFEGHETLLTGAHIVSHGQVAGRRDSFSRSLVGGALNLPSQPRYAPPSDGSASRRLLAGARARALEDSDDGEDSDSGSGSGSGFTDDGIELPDVVPCAHNGTVCMSGLELAPSMPSVVNHAAGVSAHLYVNADVYGGYEMDVIVPVVSSARAPGDVDGSLGGTQGYFLAYNPYDSLWELWVGVGGTSEWTTPVRHPSQWTILTAAASPGLWTYVGFSIDGEGGSAKLIVDGVVADSRSLSGDYSPNGPRSTYDAAAPFRIGGCLAGLDDLCVPEGEFHGAVQHLAIYDHPVDAAVLLRHGPAGPHMQPTPVDIVAVADVDLSSFDGSKASPAVASTDASTTVHASCSTGPAAGSCPELDVAVTPFLASVSPTKSYTGQTLTITGSLLTGTTAVTVAGTDCGSVTVVSDTEVTCVLGPRGVGTGAVELFTASGAAQAAAGVSFTYAIHVLASSPSTGSLLGGHTLTLTGSLLDDAASVTLVPASDDSMLDSFPCTIADASVTATSLDCVVEGGPGWDGSATIADDFVITVQASDASAAVCVGSACDHTLSDASTPSVTAVVSDAGATSGEGVVPVVPGAVLTITGTGFVDGVVGDHTVTLVSTSRAGDMFDCAPSSASATELVCSVAADVDGGTYRLDVLVTGKGTALLDCGSCPIHFAPTITSVGTTGTPDVSTAGGADLVVNAAGGGLHDEMTVLVGGKPCELSSVAADGTSATCTIPAAHMTAAVGPVWAVNSAAGAGDADWTYTADTDTWTQLTNAGVAVEESSVCGAQLGTYVTTGSTDLADYTVETTFTNVDNDGAGVVVRRQDADNYVLATVSQDDGCAAVLVIRDGAMVSIESATGSTFTPGTAAVLAVSVAGNSLTLSVDGTVLMADVDISAAPRTGAFGLASVYSTDVSFATTTVTVGTSSAVGAQPVAVLVTPLADTAADDLWAMCGTTCEITYSTAVTPTAGISTLSGTTLTVTGTGFSTTAGDHAVFVGGVSCTPTGATGGTEVVCELPAGAVGAGTHDVRVDLPSTVGTGVSSTQIILSATVTSILTTSGGSTGSINGGTEIRVVGTGYDANTEVRVCGAVAPHTAGTTSSEAVLVSTPSQFHLGSEDAVGLGTAPEPEFDVFVSDAQDDGYEETSGTNRLERDSDHYIPMGGSTFALAAFRFAGVGLPRGATVDTAKLVLRSATTGGCDGFTFRISAHGVDHAASLTETANDLSTRLSTGETTASVEWTPGMWRWRGDTQESVDLSDIVNEVVSRPGWRRGNAILFFVSVVAGDGDCDAWMYEESTDVGRAGEFAARLVGTYTPPAVPASTVTCDVDVLTIPTLNPGQLASGGLPSACAVSSILNSGASAFFEGDTYDPDDGSPWFVNDGTSSEFVVDGTADATLTIPLVAAPGGAPVRVDKIELEFDSPPSSWTMDLSADGGDTWVQAMSSTDAPAGASFAGVAIGMADVGGTRATHVRLSVPDQGGAAWAIETVSVTGCAYAPPGSWSDVLADGFTYDPSTTVTPRVTGVQRDDDASRADGSTAGGSDITITGTLFSDTAADNTVWIDGVECVVTASTTTTVSCTTGATSVLNGGPKFVTVNVAGLGSSVPGDAAGDSAVFAYIDRWSSPTTWGYDEDGALWGPPTGCADWSTLEGKQCKDSIHIPKGQVVLLDTSPGRFYLILVEGTLLFDRTDIELDATYILIRGGAMEVGTEHAPFEQQATITMYGHPRSLELPTFGTKGLFVYRGRLDMHGKFTSKSWTRLASTATIGATSMTLQEPVDWEVGHRVAIAPTDWMFEHAETVTLTSVSGDGLTLGFTPALQWEHLGEDRVIDGATVTMRAEVGLLSRNIVFQGDDDSNVCIEVSTPAKFSCAQFGAQIMLHSPGDDSLIGRIEGVELRNVGQASRLGRYAIHFHMIGNVFQSYVRDCTVHGSHNRGIAIHGVHYLRVQRNVFLHTKGHAVFVEDGIETFNVIEGNLAMVSLPSQSLLNTDQTPASFWIVNANNYVRGNVAAGSKNYGFWYRPELSLTGTSANTPGVCPTGIPLLMFEDNVAHSNGKYGLRIFDVWIPRSDPSGCSGEPETAVMRRLLSYRNHKNGVTATSIGQITFEDFIVADNLAAGFEFRQITSSDWESTAITGGVIIAHTGGQPVGEESDAPIQGRGVNGPISFGLLVSNTKFSNFDISGFAAVHACAVCGRGGSPMIGQGGMDVHFEGVTWFNSPNRAMWRHNWEGIWVDRDGTYAGTAPTPAVVVPCTDLLPDDGSCVETTGYGLGQAGCVCTGRNVRRVGQNGVVPSSLNRQNILLRRMSGSSVGEWVLVEHLFKPSPTHSEGYTYALTAGQAYEIKWELDTFERVDIEKYNLDMYEVATGDNIWMSIDHWTWAFKDEIDRPLYWAGVFSGDTREVPAAANFSDPALSPYLLPSPDASGPGYEWLVDPHTRDAETGEPVNYGGYLTYLMDGCPSGGTRCTRSVRLAVHPCPLAGCWPPPPPPPEPEPEDFTVAWSDPATWDGLQDHLGHPLNFVSDEGTLLLGQTWAGDIPSAGDNVWIPSWKSVRIDVLPPKLGHVVVEGRLVFSKLVDVDALVLAADYIHIKGDGVLQAGSSSSPWPADKKAVIRLHGHRHSGKLNLGNPTVTRVGAKAMGVFGQLKLYAETPATLCGSLTTTVAAGATSLTVNGDLTGWLPGQSIVVTPTGYEPFEAEEVVIAAAGVTVNDVGGGSFTTTVPLASPLAFKHASIAETHGSRSAELRARVCLLSRSIVIEGAEDVDPESPYPGETTGFGVEVGDHYEGQEFGGKILVGKLYEKFDWSWELAADGSFVQGPGFRRIHSGSAEIEGVEFKHMGQNGGDFDHAIRFDGVKGSETRSFVSRSALHGGFNSAISTSRSTGIDITDNVVFRTVNSGIVLDSTADVVVSNNVVTLNIFFGSYLSNIFASEEFYTIAGIQAEGSVAVIMNNVVAGAERAAYRLSGRPCDAGAFDPAPADGSPVDTSANVFMGNEAHSALIGLFVMTGTTCDVFSDFTAWRIYDLGIFADHVTSSLTFEGATVADSTVGFMLHLMGPGSTSHVRVDKRIKLHDVLAIGATADYDCSLKTGVKSNTMCKAKKSHCFPAGMDTSALWYPIFNSAANHAPNISPWWGIGHYPAIGGQTQLDGVTFANYNNEAGCGRTVKFNAFDTNPAMFDAVHEVTTANVEWVNVAEASKFQIRPPKAKQINQDDCVDMDCDGFKHILVTDTDGTLLDGAPGSVTARAEYFSPNAVGAVIPSAQLFTADGILLAEEDIVRQGYGMPRPGCVHVTEWNAWKCAASDVKHTQLIIESMDVDTEIRRLTPGSLSVNGWTDLFNGPADHGWCFGYTCLKRVSTFYVVAAVGESHELYFQGTPPKHLRFHLVNADPDESIVLSTFYSSPQRIQSIVTDTAVPVEDLNMIDGKFKSWLVARGEHPPNNPDGGWTDQFPSVADAHGTNAFDRTSRMMTVTLKGNRPLDLVVTPTVQVSLSLAITVEDFFEAEDTFMDNLAMVLSIPRDRIFVVSVVPGSVDIDFEVAPAAKFAFAELAVDVKEDAGTATLTIEREDNVYGNLTVGYNVTVSGTATPGVHFTPVTGTVDFASQQITADVSVPVMTDGVYTASPISIQVELFNITAEGDTAYDLDVANSVATVTLLNVDPPTPEAPDAEASSSTALTVEWDIPAWTSPDAASAITRAEVQVADAHTWSTAFSTDQADVLTDGGPADFTHSVGVYTTHVFRMRVGSAALWSEWSANTSAVTSPSVCGDGVRHGDEGCDVGAVNGTGCTFCVVNVGFSCTGLTPDTCEAGCNDGIKAGDEECDDGGNVDLDGCSGSCRIESGWTCVGANSEDCSTTCGDGIIAGSEVCDDAGVSGGCAGDCLSVESGWTCTGTDTSVCQNCGNGLLEGTEVCDDMNGSSGDGCSSTCGLEAGFVCTRVTSPEMKDDCVGGPVPAVTAPSTSDIRVDGVTVTWDAADGLGLNITSYIIEAEEDGGAWAVAPGAGALAPSDVVTSGDASVFSHHVTNLTAATRYRFRVAGVTTAGTGAAGPTSVLTTTLEPPATSVDSVTDDLVDGADELGVEVEELEIVPPAPEPTPPPVVEEITAEEAEEILEGNPDAFNKTGVEPPPEASPSAAPAPVLLGKGIFVSPNVTATAGNASVFITVDRTSGTFTEVGVSWQLVAADADEAVAIDARATPATDGTDFISSSGTLTYASGVEAASFTVSLPLPSTPLWYLARVARLELVNATGGGAILPPGVGYVTILSAHAAPVISVSAPATVNEFAGVVPVTVTRSVNTVGACSVDYTVTGPAGYVTVEGGWNGTVSFADGETTKVINVTVVSDEPMDVTATRTFTVALDESSVVGAEVDSAAATASTDVEYVACGVVAGYDCPQLTFDVTETTVTEARDAFNVTAVLRRTGAMSRSVEVDVAAAFAPSTSSYLTSFGSVFTAGMPSTTVSFPADSSVAHYFVFTVSPDGLDTTMTRSVSLTLANMTMGALAATPSYVLNVDFESCGVVSDCSTAGASYKAVRSSLQLVGVSAADFSNSTALQDEFKAAYADALNAATNGDVVVTADAVEIESIEAGPTVSDSRRRRLSAPSTVVTTRVTMPGTTSATSTSQAAAAATAAQSSSFASAVGAGVSGVTSAAVTGPAPETVDAAAAGAAPPAPSPSPAPIGSSDSNTGVVVAVAIGVSLVVVASLAFVYYVFVRNPGKKKARTEPYDSPVKDTIQDLEGDEAKPSVDTRPRMHDWRCTECGFKNVARSTQCQVCRADGSPLPPVKVPSQRNTPTNAAAAAGAAGSKLFTRSPSPSPAKVSKDLRIESSDV